MKILCLAVTLFISSCAVKVAPNYNTGSSHNEQNKHRDKVINKFDKNSKKAMIKHRKKHSKNVNFKKKVKKKKNRYI